MFGEIMKNKNIVFLIIIIVLIMLISVIIYINNKNTNLLKLDYQEVIDKINNKDDFILCVSASECVHCNKYKPKLKEISNTYDIKIYYVNVDEFTDKDYEKFKVDFNFDGGTPTTILFKDGEEKTTASRIEGNEKTEKIINKLKSNGFITE